MRRWNGWGDDSQEFPLPQGGLEFIREKLGRSTPLVDATLAEVLQKVPESRLPEHELVSQSPEDRVRHARGQSLPDWLAMRSGEFGVFPDGVAFPESETQVQDLLQFAKQCGAKIIPYGGGTSVVGHITPMQSRQAVLTIDMSRMNQLLSLDEESQIATFGAGTAGPDLEAQLRARGYLLGHFPQSFELSTLGGWVASRSSGQQSLRYGRIEQLFAGGSMVTPEGVLEIPTIPASSAGTDLREIVLGSEGRMGILTEVKVRVTPLPEQEHFHVAFMPSWEQGVKATRAFAQRKIPMSLARLSNAVETETQLMLAGHEKLVSALNKFLSFRGIDAGKCMLTFGITGNKAQCKSSLKQALATIKEFGGVHTGTPLGKKWEHSRFRSPYLRHGLWDHGYAVDTLETAVDWSKLQQTVKQVEDGIRGALKEEGERVHVFTHLSHIYPQGSSAYTTYAFRVGQNYAETLARWRKLKAAGSEAIVANGGTISHQHGVGKDHAPYLEAEKGTMGMHVIQTLCRTLDPDQILNPGTLLGDQGE